jgi:hypothetical protein
MSNLTNERIDLGSGYEGELRRLDGELLGVDVAGPQGAHCRLRRTDGRCAGWVDVHYGHGSDAGNGWTLVSEEPLTLTPSIRCSCDLDHQGEGQHGFITAGRWVNAGGIVE